MIKAKINPILLKQIEAYCQWAGIYDFGYFFEKASQELLQNDQEWFAHLESLEEIV